MAEPQVPPQREPDPGRPPTLESKDWLGAGGSVLAIALSVLGLNRDPAFRAWAVGLMLLAAATGVAAILIPHYRRVTTAVAVVLVVASVGVLTLAPEPAAQVAVPSPSAGPQLSLSQVVVVAPDGGGSVATLDITVRNDGPELAVLTGVELTIDDFGYLPPCLSGSNLEVTGKYTATLPDDPQAGQVVRVTLHQQVEPGAADRFTIGLKAPTKHEGAEAPISSYVYLMRVAVVQDAAGSAVAAGQVLVDAGSPLDANGTFYFGADRDATAADVGDGGLCGGESSCVRTQVECWNANRATLLPLLAVPATRSEGGDAAASALGTG
ncbi:MAG: hypothetical protein QM779_06950 [Propionicimonas sp.]|uniref:hypothetical protein n=1 Tax=Propionicimonas sp. TaxID=1955623 RepID=UPI003D09F402